MTVTFDLNRLIATRLTEIAEAAWRDHRIMPIGDSDGRVLQIGTAATRERWVCGADHGTGVCGEPLLTHRQTAELLGLLNEDEPVLDPELPVTDVELLDEGLGGFFPGSLIHFSDVGREYRKAQG
ncbi:hypothetical protein [Streptomyces avermitilis]|uniref:hypothetical protein n=1 Tax=Streptomyces avermitilis TaxID=33903 RepID=UPI0033E59E8B